MHKMKAPRSRKPKPLTKFQQALVLKIGNQPIQVIET